LPVAVGGGELEPTPREVLVEPAGGELAKAELLGFLVAVALDVDEAAAQFGLGAFAVPGGFFAECFHHAAAGGVLVADPPGDATCALVAPHTPPFGLLPGGHGLIHKL